MSKKQEKIQKIYSSIYTTYIYYIFPFLRIPTHFDPQTKFSFLNLAEPSNITLPGKCRVYLTDPVYPGLFYKQPCHSFIN